MRYFFLLGQVILLVFVFTLDIRYDLGSYVGVIYAMVVLYSWLLPWKNSTEFIVCSITAFVLTKIAFLDTVSRDPEGVSFILVLLFVWIVAIVVKIARNAIDELEMAKINSDNLVKQKTKELTQANERLFQMIEVVEEYLIIRLDRDGHICSWNEGARKMMGYDRSDVMGRSISLFCAEEELQAGLHMNLLAEARKYNGVKHEGTCLRKNGEVFNSSILITAIRNEREALEGFTMITRDLTSRKKLEESNRRQIALNSKNAELEKFAFHTSHDLQEPLRTVESFVDVIFEDHFEDTNEELKSLLSTIQKSVGNMRSVINGLFDFSRLMEESEKELVNVEELVLQIVQEHNIEIQESNCEIRIGKLHPYEGYLYPMYQLCSNLISNAVKFTSQSTRPIVEIYSTLYNDRVELTIRDNGIGIEPKYHVQIFDLFSRLNPVHVYPGAGLGLARCKRVVEIHGGEILLKSEEGKGSEFKAVLPL